MFQTLKSLTLALFLSIQVVSPVFSEEDLILEDIMYEAKNPGASMASINGVLLQQGDVFRDYTIKEIQADQVIVEKNRQEKVLQITGGERKEHPPKPAASSLPKAQSSPSASSSKPPVPQDVIDKIDTMRAGGTGNPISVSDMMEKVSAMQIVLSLRMIWQQATVYSLSTGQTPTIDELIRQGVINESYKDGVNGDYKYTIGKEGGEIAVFADPVNDDPTLAHYLIVKTKIYVEQGRKASSKSPVYDPALKMGLSSL